MDRITISTFQLFQMFPDAESARIYFESLFDEFLTVHTARMITRIERA